MPNTLTQMVGPNADLDFYFTSVNKAYQRALAGNNRALYSQFAYVPPAGVMAQQERVPVLDGKGNTVMGRRVKFPINLAASPPQQWNTGDPRPVEPFSSIEVAVDLKRYCVPSKREEWDTWNQDLFGIIQAQLPQMMDRSLILWDWLVASTLVENAIWTPDGRKFFTPSTAQHQANPAKPGVGLYYNDVSITAIDQENVRAMLSLLENVPGPDGLPLDTDDVQMMFLAPTADMEVQLLNVLNADIAAVPVGTNAAASQTNQLKGRAQVKLFKQLARTKQAPVFGVTPQDRGKVGYLLAVPRGEDRPIAVVPARQPTPYYTGLNGSDHLRATQGAIEFGWDAFGNAKLMIPARALRFTIQPS